MTLTYADSGVNISEGNAAVKKIRGIVGSTAIPGVMNDFGLFSGGFSLKAFSGMEEPVLLAATDGVGTKLLLAQEMGCHKTVGIDLVAMSVNDLLCQGAKPLFFLDYIATGKLNSDEMATLVEGVAQGCKEAGCALIGGEMAEMPGLYRAGEYDLAGFAVGIVDKKDLITGKTIVPGDLLLGFPSVGLHSNGYSLARAFFFQEEKLSLDQVLPGWDKPLGETLLTPTKIYTRAIDKWKSRVKIKGMAHITGGGFYENLPRILPEGLGVDIEIEAIPKIPVFERLKGSGKIAMEELYRTFNMGIGMVAVISPDDREKVIESFDDDEDRPVLMGKVVEGNKVTLR